MSFSYLNVGETRLMGEAEYASLKINNYGNSALPEYRDSIFDVNEYRGYTVTRFLKKDFDLELGKPVNMSMIKARALRLKLNGSSRLPDFKGYKFEYDHEKFQITKLIKDSKSLNRIDHHLSPFL